MIGFIPDLQILTLVRPLGQQHHKDMWSDKTSLFMSLNALVLPEKSLIMVGQGFV